MKKTSDVLDRDGEVASLKLRVAQLERTSAALSARMLALFGAATKPAEPADVGAVRPPFNPAAR